MASLAENEAFERVVEALRGGRAAVFPTDTVYGIGVAVLHTSSTSEIYKVKRRDPEKAIPWLVPDVSALDVYGCDVPEYVRRLARAYWPGPLTIIVRASTAAPKAFCADDGTVALRMPDDAAALTLVRHLASPIATSSANFQGETPPRRFADVRPELLSQVAAAYGDDAARSGMSSTVVKCIGDAPEMLRLGAITSEDIERML